MLLHNVVIYVPGGEETKSLRRQFYKLKFLERTSDSLMMPFSKQEWEEIHLYSFFL